MQKKILASLLAMTMVASLAACGSTGTTTTTAASSASEEASAEETSEEASEEEAAEEETTEEEAPAEEEAAEAETHDFGGITLTFLISKPEITDAFTAYAEAWGEKNNVTFECYETSDPTTTLTEKYAAGDGPNVAILDGAQVRDFGPEKFAPLDGEEWEQYTDLGYYMNDTLYGMPLTVESQCMVVNKTAVENVIGREFDKNEYKTPEQFEALLAEMRENGMENPFIMLSQTWSMCSQLFAQTYNFQDGTAQGAFDFVDYIKDGGDPMENESFMNCMNNYALFSEYNYGKADPINADYDVNCLALVEGDAAFMWNGTWVWADLAKLIEDGDETEYEIMSFPVENEDLNGRVYAAATKYMAVDQANSTDEQIAAAKQFLSDLVMIDENQKYMCEEMSIVSAFDNNPYAPTDPLNTSLANDYLATGMTVNTFPFGTPSDHRAELQDNIQRLVTGEGTVEELSQNLVDYWMSHDPTGR